MPPRKPALPEADVLTLLNEIFESPILGLAAVEDGQIAQTFSFSVQNQDYFVQFNHSNMSQAKTTETFFAKQFQEHEIPIRRVVSFGIVNSLHYNVSAKVQGVPLSSLSEDEFRAALPSVIDQLLRISRVNTENTRGYGWLDENCHGRFDSWSAHLLGILNEVPGDFYGMWHELFQSTFLEKAQFDRYYGKMKELLPSVPNVRKLVHGDYGYGNVFVNGGKVSALLDWQNCRYGDPVLDLAATMLWRGEALAAEILEVYRAKSQSAGLMTDQLDSRVNCYLYYLGLDGLRYSARTDNRGMYDYVLSILEKVSANRHHGRSD